jgi:hypothetical protein
MTYRIVCAWCGKDLGKKEAPSSSDQASEELITHSMCAECFEKILDGLSSDPDEIYKPNDQ